MDKSVGFKVVFRTEEDEHRWHTVVKIGDFTTDEGLSDKWSIYYGGFHRDQYWWHIAPEFERFNGIPPEQSCKAALDAHQHMFNNFCSTKYVPIADVLHRFGAAIKITNFAK